MTRRTTFFNLGWALKSASSSAYRSPAVFLTPISFMYRHLALYLFACLSLFAAFTVTSCLYSTALYKRSLNKRAQMKPFGYTNRSSAINWSNLDPDYLACALGRTKVRLTSIIKTSFTSEIPQINFPVAQTVSLLNIGTTLEVVFPNGSGGSTTFQNQTLNLLQFHFHTPSEHRFNEEFFPAEMHMVHENIGSSSRVSS
jgi:carbonic anhydrase